MNYVNFVVSNRGWISDDELSENYNYYLYIREWYRTISTRDWWTDSHASVIHVSGDGNIGYNWVDYANGGVQFFSVML